MARCAAYQSTASALTCIPRIPGPLSMMWVFIEGIIGWALLRKAEASSQRAQQARSPVCEAGGSQLRHVALARGFLPALAGALLGRFLVRVGAQPLDVEGC